MSNDSQYDKPREFPKGFFASRPDEAPDFALCTIKIKKSEFLPYLTGFDDSDWMTIDVKRSKSNNVFPEVNMFKPDPQRVHDQGMQQAKQVLADAAKPAQAGGYQAPIPDDDIPF